MFRKAMQKSAVWGQGQEGFYRLDVRTDANPLIMANRNRRAERK